jgi:hypothetical protein
VLKRLTPYFPRDKPTSESIDKVLTKLISVTKKDDLSLMATRYKDILAKKIQDMPDAPVFVVWAFVDEVKHTSKRPGQGQKG